MWLKPAVGRVTKPGEKVIVIAEDDDTFQPVPPERVERTPPPKISPKKDEKELILFCGWRRDIRDIILHLDRLVMPGSQIHMCTDALPLGERDLRLQAEGLPKLRNLTIKHYKNNHSSNYNYYSYNN